MLIITAVFPGEMLSNLAFQICSIDEKRWTNEMLRVLVYSWGTQTVVEGSILVLMMA